LKLRRGEGRGGEGRLRMRMMEGFKQTGYRAEQDT
jgi:hypothetical protein